MAAGKLAEEIARQMSEARADTLRLFDIVRDEGDLRVSPGGGFRPVVWHLAHVGVFEAYWLLQKIRGEDAPDERYQLIFDPIQTPREDSKDLPTRREMEDYLARVRERALRSLDEADFDNSDPLLRDAYAFRLVLEHERQHQETLAYLLHMLDPSKKSRPTEAVPATHVPVGDASSTAYVPADAAPHAPVPETQSPSPCMVFVPEGVCVVGACGDGFAYDNEFPAHEVFVPAFRIDRVPVTNAEYARFVEAGGYERREWWDDEGWAWREKENWTCPLYWRRGNDGWTERTMFEESALRPEHPVTGVSWYEAASYARFAGKRLPTEAEWEKAASWDAEENRQRRFAWGDDEPTPALCNFNSRFWDTTPVGSLPSGASAYGCLDMMGNVWEWTADPFAGFPGFEAFPYPEYSETWFDGDHRVLKGGSWATSPPVLRSSFRNFFRRQFRIGFAGLRCAVSV